jgi:phosphoglycolate phosphatase
LTYDGDIAAILFDKDGTLFDFDLTWSVWARHLLERLAEGEPARLAQLADAIGFDLVGGRYAPGSPVIAGTPDEVARALLPHLPGTSLPALVALLNREAAACVPVEAVPLAPLLGQLRARGLRLGVATNDGAVPARAHLRKAGVEALFDSVLGSDSGHGGKPAPGQLLAFCAAVGLAPGQVAMVGDSLHDLEAARAAGMVGLGVLTGPAGADELAPHAAAVLPDIGHLPAWLDQRA